ncbi:MAG TPA: hypothetical protein VHL79_24110 [Ramlibacter sp.]|jgi:hypothetical protein|nr:hypothetical protein [Ramlibacter sp.]
MTFADVESQQQRVEAARYVLLRRLTLAMQHRMLKHLQPIDMISHVLQRRLSDPQPDLARVGADMEKVHGFTRDAVGANLDVVSWLAPEGDERIALDRGVDECLALLRSHFGFRGYHLCRAPSAAVEAVPRAAMRTVLTAVLFGLCDEARAPAQVTVRAPGTATFPCVDVAVESMPGEAPKYQLSYRRFGWDEVQALAEDEGVTLRRSAGSARLQFARLA